MSEDDVLVSDSLKGDENALASLYGKYLQPTYNFILRIVPDYLDAEDIVQESFVKAWKNLRRFEKGRSFKNWIFTIAKNTLLDSLKKQDRSVYLSDTEEDSSTEDLADASPLPDEMALDEELKDELNLALSTLSPAQKSTVILHAIEGLTFNEIAEVMEEPMDTVKTRYRRSLAKLRQMLTAEPKDEPKPASAPYSNQYAESRHPTKGTAQGRTEA